MKKNLLVFTLFIIVILNSSAQSWEVIEPQGIYDICGVGNTLYSVSNQVLLISEDHGDSWTSLDLKPYLAEKMISYSVGFFNELEGLISCKDNLTNTYDLIKTTDGGQSWVSIYPLNGEYSADFFEIEIINDTAALITGFLSNRYVITTDKGESWEFVPQISTTGGFIGKIQVLDQDVLYRLGLTGIYKSVDLGKEWTKILDYPDAQMSTFHMSTNDVGYALIQHYNNGNKLLKTTNAWESFEEIPLTSISLLAELIAPISEDEIYIIIQDVFRSTDGGNTFNLFQELPNQNTSIKIINDEWYAVGRGLARFNPNGVVGVDNMNEIEIQASVYPNPAKSDLFIMNNTYSEYSIIDIDGKTIVNGKINNDRISVNFLNNGIYFLKLKNRNDHKAFLSKFIIKH